MKRVINAGWLDSLYVVEKFNNRTKEWEVRYSSHYEDSAHREASKLTGQVRIVYPDGTVRTCSNKKANQE